MRIAFLVYSLQYGRGKYALNLLNELRKMGIYIDLFLAPVYLRRLGVPLFYVRNILLNLWDYDIVHSNSGASVLVNHPRIIETHHHDPRSLGDLRYNFLHVIQKASYDKAKRIIVPSQASKRSLLEDGYDDGKISVIPHGVDHKLFKPNRRLRSSLREKYGLSNSFVVISVGQLVKRKRHVDIIKALSGMPNTPFILVGTGEEEENILKLARKKEVTLIHFKNVSESFLVGLYNVADVYVHASALEGFGLTILEAMACGLPIIAYKTADLDQIVGNAGYLMDAGDIDGIRSALWLLRGDPEKRAQMVEIAVSQSKHYSWSESARKHAHVYRQVARAYAHRELID